MYKSCEENGVYLEGSLLKPSMTCPGADCTEAVTPEDVAATTVRVLERHVPAAVPGVMFSSTYCRNGVLVRSYAIRQ